MRQQMVRLALRPLLVVFTIFLMNITSPQSGIAEYRNVMAPPRLVIESPSTNGMNSTTDDQIVISGTAVDEDPVVEIRWKHMKGISGSATGTNEWKSPPIPLDMGTNRIQITAVDAAGNETLRRVEIIREAAPVADAAVDSDSAQSQAVETTSPEVEESAPMAISSTAAAVSETPAAHNEASMAVEAANDDSVPADTVSEAAPAATAGVDEKYTVGPGDVLEISLWKDESLTRIVTVLPDGNISFPLLGKLHVQGKTVSRIREEAAIQIAKYAPDPVVTVAVQQVNSLVIYIIGRVNRPGNYALTRNVDILQALTMAGGLTPFADEEDIKVFRKVDGTTAVYPFNYKEVISGSAMDQNIELIRGDIIVVP